MVRWWRLWREKKADEKELRGSDSPKQLGGGFVEDGDPASSPLVGDDAPPPSWLHWEERLGNASIKNSWNGQCM